MTRHTGKIIFRGSILFVFILNIVLKLIAISANCISMDEPYSIFYSQLDIRNIVHELIQGNNPPLWEIILHCWTTCFGIGPFSVRFLPMLFSSLIAVYIFLTGKHFFNFKIAITSALLFTFSNYHMVFAHEARVYPMFCLMAIVSMYHFLRFVKNPAKLSDLVSFSVANIIMCYAHYLGFFILFIQLIFSLLSVKTSKRILNCYLLFLSIFLIAYSPMLYTFITRLSVSVREGTWLGPVRWSDFSYMMRQFLNGRTNYLFFLIPLVLSGGYLIWQLFSNFRKNLFPSFFLMWFWLPFLIMFSVSFYVPMYLDRYLIFFTPALYLLIPLSLHILKMHLPFRKLLYMVFVLLMAVQFHLNLSNGRDIDKIALKVKELKRENTTIYLSPPWFDLNFMYYYDNVHFQKPYSFKTGLSREMIFPVYNSKDFNGQEVIQGNPVIFIELNAKSAVKENYINAWMKEHYQYCDSSVFKSDFWLYYYHNN